jgi:hypothetical protein
MLKECKNVRQIKGDRKRRWFFNDYFDLIVWFDEDKEIFGFQLCYDIKRFERAFTWRKDIGYSHNRIDSGEYGGLNLKASPILVRDGYFNKVDIDDRFLKESAEIDQKISNFVHQKIEAYDIRGITDDVLEENVESDHYKKKYSNLNKLLKRYWNHYRQK